MIRIIVVATTMLVWPAWAHAQLNVMISGGFSGAYNKLLPEFERANGLQVTTGSGASQGSGPQTIAAQLARGVPADDLEVIEQEIRRMESTLQTFLDFARPPKPNRRPTDLSGIVERVFALVAGRARKQQAALRFLKPSEQVTANVDNDQIQQLLLNLVLNALDAMAQGGQIEVDLHGTRDGFVELYVRDSGPGISLNILPKVFETFVSSKETGVGLGLPLSRRIAEEHGGTLTAYNLPEAGACFLLRLPAG